MLCHLRTWLNIYEWWFKILHLSYDKVTPGIYGERSKSGWNLKVYFLLFVLLGRQDE